MGAPIKSALAMAGLLALTPAAPAFAHPGGLNAEGCHNNRKTGGYHCHRGSSSRTPAPAPRTSPSGEPYYRNCTAARAAGAAPIYIGEPGYAPHLDGDSDGIACEPPR